MRRKIHLKKAKKLKFGIGNTIIIILVLILTMTFFSINYLNKNVVPVLMGYASSQVRKFSNLIINRAISKQIAEDLNVEDMFIITRSEAGEIRTIDFDPIVVNKTLNKIVNTIQLNLKYLEEGKLDLLELPDNVLIDYDEEKLSKGIIYEIPSGVIFKNSLLANIGPKIPVKLSLVGDFGKASEGGRRGKKEDCFNYSLCNGSSCNSSITCLLFLPSYKQLPYGRC